MHFLFGFLLLVAVLITITFIQHKSRENRFRLTKIQRAVRYYVKEQLKLQRQQKDISDKLHQYEQRRSKRSGRNGN